MHIFYTPDIASQTYILNEEESKHCSKVLRLGVGDLVNLVDGVGGFYTAKIVEVQKKHVYLQVVEKLEHHKKRQYRLHMAVAPTKNIDRLEWFLEKATEIGVDEFTPIICDHSERKVIKEDRLMKIVTSAVKQSQSAYHPILNPAVSFNQFIASATADSCLVAHCYQGEKNTIQGLVAPQTSALILIGPEGDFSEQEVQKCLDKGYKAVTLGDSRLRTETAALAACFEVNFLNR